MSNIDPKARTWAEIDMAALKHNFEIAKRTGKKVLCVIKANAYGHGAVHCGLFLEKYPDLEMVSFGPTLRGVHSLDERLEIATVPKFWSLLCETLKTL